MEVLEHEHERPRRRERRDETPPRGESLGTAVAAHRAVGAEADERTEMSLHPLRLRRFRDRRRKRASAEEVVAASMSGAVLLDRMMRGGLGFLRQSWQRIEFADDADDRFPGSERGDKCGGNVGDACAHLEPGGFQLYGKQETRNVFF